jgi:CMP-N-acetylneuraminic acid synthetase
LEAIFLRLGVFIPGRLKSERLPNKLILPFGDSCLWDIALLKLSVISENYPCFALAESGPLLDTAKEWADISDIKVIKREADTANVDGPLTHIFKDMKDCGCTHLMFLNPCLAFLSVNTILRSLRAFEFMDSTTATSVKPFRNWLFDGAGQSLLPIDTKRLSTKEIPPLWQAAHCFHIFDVKRFFETGEMLEKNPLILRVPEEECIDVDTKEDYEFAKWKWEVSHK